MRLLACTLGLILCAPLQMPAYAQTIELPKIDLPKVAKDKKVFTVVDNEIDVKGALVKRVEFGESTAIVTYFNKGNSPARPNFTFRLINAYGVEVASFEEHWLSSIPAGETRKENKDLYRNRVQEMFEFSAIKIPNDWKTPVYLVIDGNAP